MQTELRDRLRATDGKPIKGRNPVTYIEQLITKNPGRAVAVILLLTVFGVAGTVGTFAMSVIRDQPTINAIATSERARMSIRMNDHELRIRELEEFRGEVRSLEQQMRDLQEHLIRLNLRLDKMAMGDS